MEWVIIIMAVVVWITLLAINDSLKSIIKLIKINLITGGTDTLKLLYGIKQNTGDFLDKDTYCRHNHGKHK